MAKNISPAEIQKHLQGVQYPVSKNDLVNKARENGAPDDVVHALQGLPGDQFGGPQDIMKSFSEEREEGEDEEM